jgi:hypothetical protein
MTGQARQAEQADGAARVTPLLVRGLRLREIGSNDTVNEAQQLQTPRTRVTMGNKSGTFRGTQ